MASNIQDEHENHEDLNVSLKGVPYLHIIDDEGGFTDKLDSFVQEAGLVERGDEFSLVSIMGCQSGGKSTLMNLLFGTEFRVMDPDKRQQTTKGVWVSSTSIDDALLVMDLEGSDGRERGEAGQTFERKITLFALALSDVLMINMWNQDVGRHNAANYSLLRTVLEINLHLFQKEKGTRRTLLMFVIRDHLRPPLAELEGILRKDLATIWSNLTKPSGFESSSVTDFFDFEFIALSHKVYETDRFEEGVKTLQKRFTDTQLSNYLFKSAYRKKEVPADGFSRYADMIWETIRGNKDLDLPNQREMVAQFRCGEIAKEAYGKYSKQVQELKEQVDQGKAVDSLGETMGTMLDTAVRDYDSLAFRYHQGVFAEVRGDLEDKIKADLHALFSSQLAILKTRAINQFRSDLSTAVPLRVEGPSGIVSFAQKVSSIVSSIVTNFKNSAKASMLPDSHWSYEGALKELKETIDKDVADEKERQAKRVVTYVQKSISSSLQEPLRSILDKAEPRMWTLLRDLFDGAYETAQTTMQSLLQGVGVSAEVLDSNQRELETAVDAIFHDKLDACAAKDVFLIKMTKRFQDRFRYTDTGLPRTHKTPESIDSAFFLARDSALDMLSLFSIYRLHAPGVPIDDAIPSPAGVTPSTSLDPPVDPSLVLIDPVTKAELRERFLKDAELAYMDAKRSLQNPFANISSVPKWFWILLGILGFNEFKMILFNPLLLLLLLLGLAAFAFMQYEIPRQMAYAALDVVKNFAQNQVSSAWTAVPRASHEIARTTSSSSSDVPHASHEIARTRSNGSDSSQASSIDRTLSDGKRKSSLT